MTALNRPLALSFFIHAFLGFVFVLFFYLQVPTKEIIDVPLIVTSPPQAQNLSVIKERPKVVIKSVNPQEQINKNSRQVFGVSRNTYTDQTADSDGFSAKKGNTLAVETDQTKLLASDADALPTPTEEYLVSEMPVVISEVRPVYPPKARAEKLEGSVVLDVLVDAQGKVRQVSVIEGPRVFRADALEAMKKFIFRPARVEGSAVAVRIRYSLKFQLEY